MKITPSQKLVKILLDYNPETGELSWKARDQRWEALGVLSFPDISTFNSTFSGKTAGTIQPDGYRKLTIFNKSYFAHRIIWLWMTGFWPNQIDHKNRIRDDNRWENLRNVTHSENMKNKGVQKNNTTGYAGITLRDNGKYRVRASVNGARKNIGTFSSLEEAIAARNEAEREFHYFDNDGKPAKEYKIRTGKWLTNA